MRYDQHLDDSNLVSNIKRIIIRRKSHVCLLFTIRPDECVYFGDINIVQLLNRIFNLWLVGALVHNEYQSVVILNLLHSRLRCQWKLDNLELIKLRPMSGTSAWVLGLSWQVKYFGATELHGRALLAITLVMYTTKCGLLCLQCFIFGCLARTSILGFDWLGCVSSWCFFGRSWCLLLGGHFYRKSPM